MATPLTYTPPTPPDTSSSDEVADLVAALHDSGLLRALAGGARSYPQLVKLAVDTVDAPTLRSLIALSHALSDLDPHVSERVADGVLDARRAARAAASRPPEGPLALLRRLRDPNTRRGLSAALAALAALGGALARRPGD